MEGYRKSALLLYSLDVTDREWLLGQFDNHSRDILSTLLADLVELGIPKDSELLSQVLQQPSVSGVVAPGNLNEYIHFLSKTSADKIMAVLINEPVGFIAHFMKIKSWPWLSDAWAYLGVSKRQQIEAILVSMPSPSSTMSEAILRLVYEKMQKQPQIAKPASAWRSYVIALKNWLRRVF